MRHARVYFAKMKGHALLVVVMWMWACVAGMRTGPIAVYLHSSGTTAPWDTLFATADATYANSTGTTALYDCLYDVYYPPHCILQKLEGGVYSFMPAHAATVPSRLHRH